MVTRRPDDSRQPLAELSAGTVLADRYEVERAIGSGGMATVYLARDAKHHRHVAVKVLKPEVGESVGAERFLREIEIAANLQHPNVLPLYDSGEWNGRLFYVMPLIEGESLRDRLSREPRLSLLEIADITEKVALALDYSHSRSVVHRDIKPDNVMLTGGSVVVADFGIARALAVGSTKLTQTGLFIGTPVYMSPEQAESGSDPTGASDQYSLACVVYEMLTGDAPFVGPTAQSIVLQHWRQAAPSVRATRRDVPLAVERALHRALAKQPADRFVTVGAFATAFREAIAASHSVVDRLVGAAGRGPRIAAALAGAAVSVLLVVGVIDVVRRMRAVEPGSVTNAQQPVVAVLPFTHSGRADDKYVTDGLTEEITTRLAGIRSLRTVSSASASQYAGVPLARIARELGAQYVVTGSIGTERGVNGSMSVRVFAQLVNVSKRPEVELWRQRIEERIDAGHLFEVQAKVARGVASALSLTLNPSEVKAIDAEATANPDAYNFFLRAAPYATFSFEKLPTRSAIEMYQRAANADTTFTLAYAKLAQFQTLYYYFFDRTPTRIQQAKQALDQAMALDPTLPESRIALGYFYYFVNLDYPRAEQQFRSVLAEQPSNAELLWLLGSVARRNNNWVDAVQHMRRAVELSPRSRLYALELAVTYLLRREYAAADREFDRCVGLDSTWFACSYSRAVIPQLAASDLDAKHRRLREAQARVGHGTTLEWLLPNGGRWELASQGLEFQGPIETLSLTAAGIDSGDYLLALADLRRAQRDVAGARAAAAAAVPILERRVRDRPGIPELRGSLGVAYAGVGRREDALREGLAATRLVPASRDAFRGPSYERTLLEIRLLLGDTDEAITITRRLLSIPMDISVPYIKVDPHFEAIRSTPNFRRFLDSLGTSR